jgi:DNA mismatch repair protein MutH
MGIRLRNDDGRTNKGWAGHTLERFLGLPLNSSQSPNFGSWELKLASLCYRKSGTLRVKETIAITMIDPVEVASKPFEDSHLYRKLCKQIVVARIWESKNEERSLVHSVATFDLDNPEILRQVKEDYELVRGILKDGGKISDLSGRMGVLVQPRTKGPGGLVFSRAFYARTLFVAHILNIAPLSLDPPVSP